MQALGLDGRRGATINCREQRHPECPAGEQVVRTCPPIRHGHFAETGDRGGLLESARPPRALGQARHRLRFAAQRTRASDACTADARVTRPRVCVLKKFNRIWCILYAYILYLVSLLCSHSFSPSPRRTIVRLSGLGRRGRGAGAGWRRARLRGEPAAVRAPQVPSFVDGACAAEKG